MKEYTRGIKKKGELNTKGEKGAPILNKYKDIFYFLDVTKLLARKSNKTRLTRNHSKFSTKEVDNSN